MSDTLSPYLTIGIILRHHGLAGELVVRPETDFPERFSPGATVYIDGRAETVEKARNDRGRVLLKIEGVDGEADARALRGKALEVHRDQRARLPEGSYYHTDLIGLEVYTTGGEHLGKLTRIISTGANDVYAVAREGEEVLLPATEEVVVEVDVAAGRMTVKPLPGLLELNRKSGE
jgi:16S rRNA processing protein RimM